MKYSDIPVLSDHGNKANKQSEEIGRSAPRYLRSLIENTRALSFVRSLDDLDDDELEALTGGQDAATYLVQHQGKAAIVKFGYAGLKAEAEALRAWRSKHVRCPTVWASGTVPQTQGQRPVGYIIEEAIVDNHGRLAETCDSFLRHSPSKARRIGQLMGMELSKLHSCISQRSFGDFGDMEANTAAYSSWNNYLLDFLEAQRDFIDKHQVKASNVEALKDFIKSCKFVKQGRYLHGDFSVRNTAIKPNRERIVVFDPNPVIGDPSWDIAVLYNNLDFSQRRFELDGEDEDRYKRDQQLLIGFRQGYGRQINEDNLLTARIIQGILHTRFHENKVEAKKGDKRNLRVRRETVIDLIKQVGAM